MQHRLQHRLHHRLQHRLHHRSKIALTAAVAAIASLVTSAPAGASIAWDDDPCGNLGGLVAMAPDMGEAPRANHANGFAVCGYGYVLYHGADGRMTQRWIDGFPVADFVDATSLAGGGMVAVTSSGQVATLGTYYRGDVRTTGAVAVSGAPDGRGYWIVNSAGRVFGFGSAPSLWPRQYTVVHSRVVAFAPSGPAGGWLVTALGEVVPVGNAPDLGSVDHRVPYGDRVVAIVTDHRSGGYWVVTRSGRVLEQGGAPAEHDAARCLTSTVARPPVTGAVADTRPGASAPLWLYTANGGICGFDPYV